MIRACTARPQKDTEVAMIIEDLCADLCVARNYFAFYL
jgi:hypothetical protein